MGAKTIAHCIDFRLHASIAEELLMVYEAHLTSYDYSDAREALLCEHIKDMYLRLKKMVQTIEKTAKLSLTNSEAMAFYQVWNEIDTTPWPLANVILIDMVAKIDKRIKAPKRYGI